MRLLGPITGIPGVGGRAPGRKRNRPDSRPSRKRNRIGPVGSAIPLTGAPARSTRRARLARKRRRSR